MALLSLQTRAEFAVHGCCEQQPGVPRYVVDAPRHLTAAAALAGARLRGAVASIATAALGASFAAAVARPFPAAAVALAAGSRPVATSAEALAAAADPLSAAEPPVTAAAGALAAALAPAAALAAQAAVPSAESWRAARGAVAPRGAVCRVPVLPRFTRRRWLGPARRWRRRKRAQPLL